MKFQCQFEGGDKTALDIADSASDIWIDSDVPGE